MHPQDQRCRCGAGRRREVIDGAATDGSAAPEVMTQVDVDSQIRLWRDVFKPGGDDTDTQAPASGQKSCFCHAAYGYGLAWSRKDVRPSLAT